MSDFTDLIADVLAVDPGVEDELRRRDLTPTPDLEIPTVWVGGIGSALVSRFDVLSEHQRSAVFAVVETHLRTGSDLLKTSIATGLLEVVGSAISGGRLDGPTVAGLLGPQSRAYLDAWDQFTLGRSSLDPA